MTNTLIQENLEAIGLTENEASLYQTMIANPQATVRELQSRTPFPRTQIYHILDGLKAHGLVTSTKERARTRYIAEDPEQLLDVLKKKEQQFDTHATTLRSLIPNLKNQYKGAQAGGSFKVFVGSEKYRQAYEDIIKTKPQTVYTFVHAQPEPLPGVDIRADIRSKMRTLDIKEETVPSFDPGNVELHLYAGKILYTSMTDSEPVATLIEDKHLYTFYRNIFDALKK